MPIKVFSVPIKAGLIAHRLFEGLSLGLRVLEISLVDSSEVRIRWAVVRSETLSTIYYIFSSNCAHRRGGIGYKHKETHWAQTDETGPVLWAYPLTAHRNTFITYGCLR